MRDADASTPRRPRPVADAPVAPFARGTGLAKAWVLELLRAAPLEDAGHIATSALSRDAPALCAAICRAIGDDAALDALSHGGSDARLAARVVHLAAADDGPGAVVRSVDLLRSVIWESLRAEVPRGADALLADLADRLSFVCGVIAVAALDAQPGVDGPARPPAGIEPLRAADVEPEGVVALHDVRGRHDLSQGWQSTIERRLERHERDGGPFSVVLAEIDDFATLLEAHTAEELAVAVQAVERALVDALAPGDVLAREEAGRYWLTLSDVDAAGARDVAVGIATSVQATVALRGAGLAVSSGVAVCPQDGTVLEQLEARADERLFLARASGVPVEG